MGRKVLALDQASHISGFAIFEGKELIEYGKITLDNTLPLGDRLWTFRNKIIELIGKYEIEEVIFEDIQLQTGITSNVQTFKVLAEVYGVLDELCTELKLPYQSVLASVWKSCLGIKGKTRPEQKRNAQEYVVNNYGIKATQDESDAICIGTYLCKNNWTK